jgi:hypothetical protein
VWRVLPTTVLTLITIPKRDPRREAPHQRRQHVADE